MYITIIVVGVLWLPLLNFWTVTFFPIRRQQAHVITLLCEPLWGVSDL